MKTKCKLRCLPHATGWKVESRKHFHMMSTDLKSVWFKLAKSYLIVR